MLLHDKFRLLLNMFDCKEALQVEDILNFSNYIVKMKAEVEGLLHRDTCVAQYSMASLLLIH